MIHLEKLSKIFNQRLLTDYNTIDSELVIREMRLQRHIINMVRVLRTLKVL